MKIDNIIWSEVRVEHIDPRKRDLYENTNWKNCTVSMIGETLYINEYSGSQGSTTGRNMVLGNAKLTYLQPWCMRFEAEWFESVIGSKKKKLDKHKVHVSIKL